ncbi:MAG: type IV toxin-antitoxin system AbiEi family antitoxin domain-containing protein [Bacillota bacterium]|nr:type IV toxin-antitoxin system AbiEi family antitoxin domain-containing protein [Bacillota bacterium]
MKKDKEKLVSRIIEKKELFITAERLKSYGLNTYDIGLLLSDGRLERIKRGLYKWTYFQQEYNEMVEVSGIVPEGYYVFFQHSAFTSLQHWCRYS